MLMMPLTIKEKRPMPGRSENHDALEGLFDRLRESCGEKPSKEVIKIILEELGGLRISIPTLKELYKKERNKRIREIFNGANHEELAIRFGLSLTHVRWIVQGD